MKATTRRRLGRHFSEGTRRMWIEVRRRGWDQTELADKIGVEYTRVHRYIWGDVVPPLGVLASIDRVLRIAPLDFARPPRRPFQPTADAA